MMAVTYCRSDIKKAAFQRQCFISGSVAFPTGHRYPGEVGQDVVIFERVLCDRTEVISVPMPKERSTGVGKEAGHYHYINEELRPRSDGWVPTPLVILLVGCQVPRPLWPQTEAPSAAAFDHGC